MRRAEMDALAAGFTGLRVAGDWAWTLEPRVLDTELSEFESLLEITAGPGRLTLACLYRRDRTDPAALERMVREHGKVIASDYILLGLSALFRSLARTDLQSLAQSARARTIRKGGAYFRQGDPATEVYLLTSGLVKLVRTDAAGRSVILSLVAPMQPFGEGGLALREDVRLVSAEALEDSRALAWDRSAVLRDIMSHPAVSIGAVRVLLDRVASDVSRLDDSALPDVRRRLATRLSDDGGRRTACPQAASRKADGGTRRRRRRST